MLARPLGWPSTSPKDHPDLPPDSHREARRLSGEAGALGVDPDAVTL